jgi:hypothetical protein
MNIFRKHGYIPPGIGYQSAVPGLPWDEFSDNGAYADLITAAAMWLLLLKVRADWH